ncbi:MAG: hypothetical protein HOP11_14670 [Saprospiraceae bacterium]|nr:hypothetical protein [Saprospiraceae bacterium]
MKQIFSTLIIMGLLLVLSYSCNKDEEATGTDKELLNLVEEKIQWVYFKNSTNYLTKSVGSGHNFSLLKTRYNALAASQLDANGKIISNAKFPEGSLIVKDLTNTTHHVERYAILYKQSTHKDADAKGWVWGYINTDGTVATSASDKGSICIGCHSQSDNIDYMLMNKFFP